MIIGSMKEGLVPTGTWLWVDVRVCKPLLTNHHFRPVLTLLKDVAAAHVNAIEKPEAGGKRFFITAGQFSNQQMADIIIKNFPQLADKLPAERESNDGFPEGGVYDSDNTRSRQVLGIEYISLEKSIVDLVNVLLKMGA